MVRQRRNLSAGNVCSNSLLAHVLAIPEWRTARLLPLLVEENNAFGRPEGLINSGVTVVPCAARR
jgi:hypothetical protein